MSNYLTTAAIFWGHTPGAIRAAAVHSQAGDPLATRAVVDWVEEESVGHNPFAVGEKVFLCSVTLYYVGEVEEIGFGWVRLQRASWVHWTGRLSLLLASGDLTQTHGSRKPRSEYVGVATVYLQSLVSHYPWKGELPEESVQ